MSELYMMVTITNRQLTRKFVECYKEKGAQVGSVTVGMGTAANEILDYFGLDGMEKSVLFHLVTDAAWRQIKPALRKKMQIDLPDSHTMQSVAVGQEVLIVIGEHLQEDKIREILKEEETCQS